MRPLLLSWVLALGFVIPSMFPAYAFCTEDRSPTFFETDLFWFDLYPAGAILPSGDRFNSDDFVEFYPDMRWTIVKTPTDGGIRLDIPDKYKERFEKWKEELLATDFGRRQWDTYATNKKFILNIKVTGDIGKGAGTGSYMWDDSGKLVGATITLGDEIDKGYPSPIYYPVMSSLSAEGTKYVISGKILAATKISHELGHVNQTANVNPAFLQTQNKLMPVYMSIFLKNGRNSSDQKLIDLVSQMGGTPVEIWESREYWSEVTAMRYLTERINREDFYCYVFGRIRRNVEEYAKPFEKRFDQNGELSNSPCWK